MIISQLLVLMIGIIMVVMGSINYHISPAPTSLDMQSLSNYPGKVFCVPLFSIDNTATTAETHDMIQGSINHGYQLMISSIVLGVVLILISIYMILQKK